MKERTKTPQQICEQTNRIFGLIDMQSREGKDRAILRARNHKVSLCCQRYIANIYEYIKGDERKTLSIEEINNLWYKANVVKGSEYVIGRTPAYYQDEDDFVFTPNYWVCCPVLKIDKYIDPQSPIYRLTPKGEERFDDWADKKAAGYDLCYGRCMTDISSEEMFDILTTDSDYSIKIR